MKFRLNFLLKRLMELNVDVRKFEAVQDNSG